MIAALAMLLAVLMCPLPAYGAASAVAEWHSPVEECSAGAMILYEPRTGTVLAQREPDARMLVASTTKLMTALVVLEHCALNETVIATEEQAAVEGSSMYLIAGETYTVEQLLYGLLLASGNDAALALAEHTAGSVPAFAALMNDKCAALGLENTHFMNPHGLDDPEHYSCARDLARIMAAALERPELCRMLAVPEYETHGNHYVNHNKLLQSCEGCIGGKTGYTRAAGRVLVSCAERDGLRLICVTISDPDDWEDHRRLYDDAFARWRYVALPGAVWDSLPVLSGTAACVPLVCDCPGLLLPTEQETQVVVELPRFVFAPVADGQTLGSVTVTVNGECVLRRPLCAAAAVSADASVPLRIWERVQRGLAMSVRYGRLTVYPPQY